MTIEISSLKHCLLILLLLGTLTAKAQFSFHPREYRSSTGTMSVANLQQQLTFKSNKDTDEKLFRNLKSKRGEAATHQNDITQRQLSFYDKDSARGEEELDKVMKYVSATQPAYNKIVDKGKKLEDLSKKDRNMVLVHKAVATGNVIGVSVDASDNFRTSSPQAITGLSMFNNVSGKYTAAALELGGRLNNTRISLPSYIRFSVDTVKVADSNGKEVTRYVINRYQRNKYLYFDFISRGLVSLDSIKNSVSEYVNTTQGSLLTSRLHFQWNLMPAYLQTEITGVREPQCHAVLDVDARLVPIAGSNKIDDAGMSFHLMPAFIYVAPAGQLNSDAQDDNFIIQFSANVLYTTDNVKKALMPSASGFTQYDVLVSAELRAGYYSLVNPERNFSFFAKYCFQKTTGPQWTAGFNFTPQTKNPDAAKNSPANK